MANTEISIVAGWTGAITVVLESGGLAAPLTGAAAEFVLRDASGRDVGVTGTTSITSELAGRIQFLPASGDFATAGLYSARVKVTYGDGTVVFFPNKDPIKIVVGS